MSAPSGNLAEMLAAIRRKRQEQLESAFSQQSAPQAMSPIQPAQAPPIRPSLVGSFISGLTLNLLGNKGGAAGGVPLTFSSLAGGPTQTPSPASGSPGGSPLSPQKKDTLVQQVLRFLQGTRGYKVP